MKVAVEEWELYNNGILLCKWFDLEETDIEEVEEFILHVKAKNGLNPNDLEAFVADVEGETLGLITGDESLCEAYEVQEKLKEVDSNDLAAVKLMLENNIVNDIDEAVENIPNMVSTGENSMEDIAQSYINECSLLEKMPENLQCYFDFESFGRDMEINGSFYEDEEGILWEFIA